MWNAASKLLFAVSLSGGLFLSLPAIADDAANAQLEHNYAALLQNPTNRQLNLDYAAVAMQHQDYEAAIPPLERILMSEPSNAKIRLQIGILYHLLKSDVIAKQYFMEASTTNGAPADVVKEAQGYLHGS